MTAVDVMTERAKASVESARSSLDKTDKAIQKYSRLDYVSRFGIGIVVMIVWAAIVIGIGIWTISDTQDFVCSRPGDPTAADYAGECESGFSETRDALQNLLTVGVLPLVTLVLGFYFGKQSTESAQNED